MNIPSKGPLFILLCGLAGFALLAGCSKPMEKPNIVFILADDMGHSDLGCYGAEIIETPHIDALARAGLRFTNFYNTGRCWPTRTSFLSGYYPHQVLSDPIQGFDYENGSSHSGQRKLVASPFEKSWLQLLSLRQMAHLQESFRSTRR